MEYRTDDLRGVGDAELSDVRCPECGEAISDEQYEAAHLKERLPPGREWAYIHREGGHDLILKPLPKKKKKVPK